MAIYNCDYLAAGAAYGNADCNIFSGTDELSCNNYYSIIQGPEFGGSELAYQCVWDTSDNVCKSYNNDSFKIDYGDLNRNILFQSLHEEYQEWIGGNKQFRNKLSTNLKLIDFLSSTQ